MSDEQQIQASRLEEARAHKLRLEKLFLESEWGNAVKNKTGVYAYQSKDGNHMMRLDDYLSSYKEWLIENKFIKEI